MESPFGNNQQVEGERDGLNNELHRMNPHPISFREYCKNMYFLAELIFCVTVAALGHIAPHTIISLNERVIPYQKTNEGDILYDLYLDREYLEKESVPDWLLIVLCIIMPLLVTITLTFFFGPKIDIHSGVCAYLFAFGCNSFITDCVKRYVGYWRPNFYNYCVFNEDDLECESDNMKMSEPRKSFPSGHASHSFMGMTMLTLFFLGKIGFYRAISGPTTFDRANMNAMDSSFLLKQRLLTIIGVLPMLLALYVSASRVHDDYHHPADVVAGSMIGMLCSVFSYSLWYAPLSSKFSGYSIYTAFEIMKNSNLY